MVLCLLFLDLSNFEQEVVNVFADLITLISFVRYISLQAGDINFLACDLVTCSTEVLLNVTDNSRFLVEKESEVIHLFLESDK